MKRHHAIVPVIIILLVCLAIALVFLSDRPSGSTNHSVATMPSERPAHTASVVDQARDTSIPLATREKIIDDLGRSGDAEATDNLLAIAESRIYLSARAIRSLGMVNKPEVVAYLRRRVADTNSLRVVELAEAAKSLGNLQGEQAIPELATLMAASRERKDGLDEDVVPSCLDALVAIGGDQAAAVLAAALATMSQDPEQAARVVQALKKMGRPLAIKPLIAHADALMASLPAVLERQRHLPGGNAERGAEQIRRHYEKLSNEARQVASSMINREVAVR